MLPLEQANKVGRSTSRITVVFALWKIQKFVICVIKYAAKHDQYTTISQCQDVYFTTGC